MKMASSSSHGILWHHLAFVLFIVIIFSSTTTGVYSQNTRKNTPLKLNAIDRCWRLNPNWKRSRHQLATCSVGFVGKMTGNIGQGTITYKVTDPSDDPVNPRRGTLRYGATMIKGKVWITFERDMRIKLKQPLLVSSFTTIDGRGSSVHIAGGSGLLLYKVSNVIIHGIRIHDCRPQVAGPVMGPDLKITQMSRTDGDAIRLVGCSKIWIDHNTLYECTDGLLDVTLGSTDITVSNNWFRNHDKVMLLGHDDGFKRDKNMRVTVAFNHFGPDCSQRMPRVRHGYVHVVNNLYKGWEHYAIGGSMNPSIMSEANLFIASRKSATANKEVTWRQDESTSSSSSWNFQSVGDVFENGASFRQTRGDGKGIRVPYTRDQNFRVADARKIRSLTRSSGALRCPRTSRC